MSKAIVVFYSYSGNTKAVAEILKSELKNKFETDFLELKCLDESDAFLTQASRALFKKPALLKHGLKYDLSEYDLIAVGTPVWAFAPAPCARIYLQKCTNIKNKQILLFATYGSGLGTQHCLKQMSEILKNKQVAEIKSFLVQQCKIDDLEFVKSAIKKALQ
ncbi:MAG: hypothetical protein DRP78_00915 [Candidatus Omnitrophota bacterium]|nr:MAG: hypothetical protein DRP78_00915 [Candidatus Omnitrophota bacterium]